MSAQFLTVAPIGETQIEALPIKEVGPAVGYYTQVLGFTVRSKTSTSVLLTRDLVEIGLAVNGHDPEQASCYFGVRDLDALHREFTELGIEPSAIRIDTYGTQQYRVFFAKEPFGVCFCFGQALASPV